jgi:hypothetical protein
MGQGDVPDARRGPSGGVYLPPLDGSAADASGAAVTDECVFFLTLLFLNVLAAYGIIDAIVDAHRRIKR